jgi:hypothetical protein
MVSGRYVEVTREDRLAGSEIVGRFGAPYTMPYEKGPIMVCHELIRPLPQIWHLFKRYR